MTDEPTPSERLRRLRDSRVTAAVATVATAAVGVLILRTSPRAVVAVVGKSGVGSALASMRGS